MELNITNYIYTYTYINKIKIFQKVFKTATGSSKSIFHSITQSITDKNTHNTNKKE